MMATSKTRSIEEGEIIAAMQRCGKVYPELQGHLKNMPFPVLQELRDLVGDIRADAMSSGRVVATRQGAYP